MPLSRRPSLRRALAPCFALALVCAGLFLAPRSLDAGLTSAASPQAAVDTIREMPFVTNDIVYDPATKLIYASVPGRVGAGGNSITPIDPSQSAAGAPVFVGSEPRRMALSDDGQYIYVGLDGAGAVRRYDVAAHTPDLFFDIGGVGTRDIVVMHDDPHAVAVSRMNLGVAPGLASIFDEGVARPSSAGISNGNTGLYIEPSSSPSVLYGTDGAVPLRLREFLPDTQTIGAGVVVNQGEWQKQLEANKGAFFEEFVSRAAFVAAYPASLSAAQYVDALNANTGGALSAAERNQLVADLNAGALTRGQVLRAVAENNTFSAREKNRAFVLMQYFGYLRRNPDDAPEEKRNFDGFNFWLGKLNDNGGNFVRAEMVKGFITSDEYRKRFGL